MSIVDKINEKTGKFANNIAEAVADLLGNDLKATSIVDAIGEGNNITEALDNLSGKSSSNIAEAVDNYYGNEHTGTTIEEALDNAGDSPEPEPEPPGPEPEPEDDFDRMTKSELQQYAEDNYISGVDSASQTKAEMIEIIRESLDRRIVDRTLGNPSSIGDNYAEWTVGYIEDFEDNIINVFIEGYSESWTTIQRDGTGYVIDDALVLSIDDAIILRQDLGGGNPLPDGTRIIIEKIS